MKVFSDPKTMATVLTQDGFLKWAEGAPLAKTDFKPQWAYLFKDVLAASLGK